jgi:hypothetical protein
MQLKPLSSDPVTAYGVVPATLACTPAKRDPSFWFRKILFPQFLASSAFGGHCKDARSSGSVTLRRDWQRRERPFRTDATICTLFTYHLHPASATLRCALFTKSSGSARRPKSTVLFDGKLIRRPSQAMVSFPRHQPGNGAVAQKNCRSKVRALRKRTPSAKGQYELQ